MSRIEYKTKIREAIKNYLIENQSRTVNVKEIDTYLKGEGMEVSLSSIYRYLDKLLSESSLSKITNDSDKGVSFQYTANITSHEHIRLLCTNCRRVEQLDCEKVPDLMTHIKEEHGFSLETEDIIFTGLCKDCTNRRKNEE